MPKRLFDLVASAVGLVALLPLLLALAVAIRLTSPGPALHHARRVGQAGRAFTLYKLRTMVADAAAAGPGITAAGDPRITHLGALLRRTKLDELPQLWNVLKGDMSLVGPRPEDPRYVALYSPEQRRTLAVRPGITSLASIKFRHEERLLQGSDWERAYCEEVLPSKLAIELEYLERRSVILDLYILFATLGALFAR